MRDAEPNTGHGDRGTAQVPVPGWRRSFSKVDKRTLTVNIHGKRFLKEEKKCFQHSERAS